MSKRHQIYEVGETTWFRVASKGRVYGWGGVVEGGGRRQEVNALSTVDGME